MTLASVKGGKIPFDPKSVVSPYLTTIVKKGLTDGTILDFSYLTVHSTTSAVTASNQTAPTAICMHTTPVQDIFVTCICRAELLQTASVFSQLDF